MKISTSELEHLREEVKNCHRIIESLKQPEQEPMAFEEWHSANYVQTLEKYGDTYKNTHVRNRWLGWLGAKYTPPAAQRTWARLMRGVNVKGDTVVIYVKGGNDGARELCGQLIDEMEIRHGND